MCYYLLYKANTVQIIQMHLKIVKYHWKVFFFSWPCVRLLFNREVQKRAQGRKRLGKKNFKKRWLRVTNRELSYHKHKGETYQNWTYFTIEWVVNVNSICLQSQYHSQPLDGARVKTFQSPLIIRVLIYWLDLFIKWLTEIIVGKLAYV